MILVQRQDQELTKCVSERKQFKFRSKKIEKVKKLCLRSVT